MSTVKLMRGLMCIPWYTETQLLLNDQETSIYAEQCASGTIHDKAPDEKLLGWPFELINCGTGGVDAGGAGHTARSHGCFE